MYSLGRAMVESRLSLGIDSRSRIGRVYVHSRKGHDSV